MTVMHIITQKCCYDGIYPMQDPHDKTRARVKPKKIIFLNGRTHGNENFRNVSLPEVDLG